MVYVGPYPKEPTRPTAEPQEYIWIQGSKRMKALKKWIDKAVKYSEDTHE